MSVRFWDVGVVCIAGLFCLEKGKLVKPRQKVWQVSVAFSQPEHFFYLSLRPTNWSTPHIFLFCH